MGEIQANLEEALVTARTTMEMIQHAHSVIMEAVEHIGGFTETVSDICMDIRAQGGGEDEEIHRSIMHSMRGTKYAATKLSRSAIASGVIVDALSGSMRKLICELSRAASLQTTLAESVDEALPDLAGPVTQVSPEPAGPASPPEPFITQVPPGI